MKEKIKKIIKYLISLLEFEIKKGNKVYTEAELEEFAKKAKLYRIIFPLNTFPYAVKAKKSKNPEIVKKAENAEIVAFFFCLPIFLAVIIGIGSWIFSGTWFALVPIAIIGFIVFKILRKKRINK